MAVAREAHHEPVPLWRAGRAGRRGNAMAGWLAITRHTRRGHSPSLMRAKLEVDIIAIIRIFPGAGTS